MHLRRRAGRRTESWQRHLHTKPHYAEYLATRRAAGLGKCFEDEAPQAVLVRLGRHIEVLEADEDARACLTAALKAWPWPDEARGLVSIHLETALLL